MKLRPLLLPLLGLLLLAAPSAAFAQFDIGVSVALAPPPLPVYTQPPLPALGYIWVPGYWAYADSDYFWVPGTWVEPPQVGYLWTPGYWAWANGEYAWNGGYWGTQVGFYGGINYGYGYSGNGYQGGRWNNGTFAYNRAANNLGSVHVASTFNTPVSASTSTRASFNGGKGGINARASAAQQATARQPHTAATSTQTQHIAAAQSNRALFASQNHGAPPIAATSHAGQLTGAGVVAARSAPQRTATHAATTPATATHAATARPSNATRTNAAAQRTPTVRTAQPRTVNRAAPAPAVRAAQRPAAARPAQAQRAPQATRPAPAPHQQAAAPHPAAEEHAPAAAAPADHEDEHR
jgi:hypothetical protein